MDSRAVIAHRIDLHLRRHLGQGIDAALALRDETYALDVLLVCDAMQDTELPRLARQFRSVGERAADRRAGPPQPRAADTSGFGTSQPVPLTAPRPPRPGPRGH